jgi:hypothetical protein
VTIFTINAIKPVPVPVPTRGGIRGIRGIKTNLTGIKNLSGLIFPDPSAQRDGGYNDLLGLGYLAGLI